MSYSKMTTAKMTTANMFCKVFCKFCQDAGKTEKEYTSHSLRSRDRNGSLVVTCPTILLGECRFCHKKGHTAKYCPAVAAKYTPKAGIKIYPELSASAKETVRLPTTIKTVFNGFSALANLDSGDKDESLIQAKPAPKTHPSWADIATVATKPIVVHQAADLYENYSLCLLVTRNAVHKPHVEETKTKSIPIPTRKVYTNWADCESSDSDENYTRLTQTVGHKTRYEEDPSPKSIPLPTHKVHCNWADAESSDSDDDDNASDNEWEY